MGEVALIAAKRHDKELELKIVSLAEGLIIIID